jgi:hypothetical protein
LRHCATSRKVSGSIPVGVTGIFHWLNPSGHIMTLGSTQPVTEMSTRDIFWRVKVAGAYGWQPYHLRVPIVKKLWDSEPPEAQRAWDSFTLFLVVRIITTRLNGLRRGLCFWLSVLKYININVRYLFNLSWWVLSVRIFGNRI